jgi:hypothetical protein
MRASAQSSIMNEGARTGHCHCPRENGHGEKKMQKKFPAGPGEATENLYMSYM